MKMLSRIVATAALAVAATVPALLPATAAHAALTAQFTVQSEWSGGYTGVFHIRNDTDQPLEDWRIEFRLPEGTELLHPWGVRPAIVDGRYVLISDGWNSMLAPGASTYAGFLAAGNGKPYDCTINGARCDGAPDDLYAPSAPSDARVDLGPGVTLLWEPSTDDSGSVRYEVFDWPNRVATTTEPSYVISETNVLPPKIYIWAVRAVDAAGNVSPAVFAPMGAYFEDVAPPAATSLAVDASAGSALRLSWTLPSTPPQLSVPPIAGFEVYVDGVLVDRVGTARASVPRPPSGTHTIGVRAFNAVGRYADLLEVQHTVP